MDKNYGGIFILERNVLNNLIESHGYQQHDVSCDDDCKECVRECYCDECKINNAKLELLEKLEHVFNWRCKQYKKLVFEWEMDSLTFGINKKDIVNKWLNSQRQNPINSIFINWLFDFVMKGGLEDERK